MQQLVPKVGRGCGEVMELAGMTATITAFFSARGPQAAGGAACHSMQNASVLIKVISKLTKQNAVVGGTRMGNPLYSQHHLLMSVAV